MGPTPTPTLGLRLSCNFVNVYTIVYYVQHAYPHVDTRASPTDILARKSARRTKVRGLCRRDERTERAAAVGLPRRLPREDCRAEVGEEVRVGVSVRVGPVEI